MKEGTPRRSADLEAEGGVEGKVAVAADESELFADGGPNEHAVEGVLMLRKAGQGVEGCGGIGLEGGDVPPGFSDE